MINIYGILISLSIFLCILVVLTLCRPDEKETVWKIAPWIIIGGVIGARVYHVISDFELYKNNLPAVFYIWNGGLGFWGGVFGGLVGAVFALRKYRLERVYWVNMLSVVVPLGQAVGRWGNFFNGELYGTTSQLPWAFNTNGQKLHPVFLYESILNLINFAVLYVLYKKSTHIIQGRQIRGYFFTALYFVNYSVIRFLMEFFRPTHWLVGQLNLSLAIPILVFSVSLAYLISKRRINL